MEITDLNRIYLEAGALNVRTPGRDYAWLDTDTMDSLFEAGKFVRTVQRAQGLPIAIVEEITFEKRLYHPRAAHGVRGALWREPVRSAFEEHRRW